MKRIVFALATLLVVAASVPALAQPVPVATLLREPARFDHRPVTVTGMVGALDAAGRSGAPTAQTFVLIDGGMSIRVTGPPAPVVRMGDRVEVEGIFKLVGNQIEAFRITWR